VNAEAKDGCYIHHEGKGLVRTECKVGKGKVFPLQALVLPREWVEL